MGRKMGRRFKTEGIYVYLWLIHVDVWHKPTQFCKAIILQLKNNLKNKERNLKNFKFKKLYQVKLKEDRVQYEKEDLNL